ncbi:MAG: ribose-phosphate pyrophosphokinase [Betaproteobacteria bacterium]
MSEGEMKVFALNSGRSYGELVCRELGVPLAAHEEREFEDGEHKSRSLVSVRGCDVYVVQSLYGDAQQSVDDKLMRVLLFVGALRDASAARVTVVAPYLAYSRKDQKSKPRDPVTTRYVASFFEAAGADCMVTMDVHNLAAYQNAWRCRTEHLEAAPLFVRHVLPQLGAADVGVVSPDAGGIKRADAFRQRLARALGRPLDMAFAEKYRSGGEIRGEALVGDVAGKVAIIVDDLISAGNTIARAARACRDRGAVRVIACASHGVFATDANSVLAAAAVDEIVVTDSIPPLRITDAGVAARIRRVATAPLFADAIRRLHAGDSLVELEGN